MPFNCGCPLRFWWTLQNQTRLSTRSQTNAYIVPNAVTFSRSNYTGITQSRGGRFWGTVKLCGVRAFDSRRKIRRLFLVGVCRNRDYGNLSEVTSRAQLRLWATTDFPLGIFPAASQASSSWTHRKPYSTYRSRPGHPQAVKLHSR